MTYRFLSFVKNNLCLECTKRKCFKRSSFRFLFHDTFSITLANVEGFEPSSSGLEADILPLNYTDLLNSPTEDSFNNNTYSLEFSAFSQLTMYCLNSVARWLYFSTPKREQSNIPLKGILAARVGFEPTSISINSRVRSPRVLSGKKDDVLAIRRYNRSVHELQLLELLRYSLKFPCCLQTLVQF